MRIVVADAVDHQQHDNAGRRHQDLGRARDRIVDAAANVPRDQPDRDADDKGDGKRLGEAAQADLSAP
jgi:hypothetical protein